MKKSTFLSLIFIVITTVSLAQQKEEIHWKTFPALEEALKEEQKPVFIFFYADWCAYCKKIKRQVFTNPQVIEKLNTDYYAVMMDAESKERIAFDGKTFSNEQAKTQRNGIHEIPLLLASRNDIPFSLPATVILTKDFKVKKRVFEYYTSEEILEML
ncbi:thioredoxin family protein [Galbibacter sp. BG1]|uniref:thioredoxin family protein n=1 Tax=Galbibacter sp. BG1 TaxID=1170699 RepID=UPI0015B7BBD3|nr:thioredoxin family protein [Galbibacter sp. BG1]QLE00954.1 thioredoxin family protein [Galbibacter sp. BG1]